MHYKIHNYIIGFILSVLLTLAAYASVVLQLFSLPVLLSIILILAAVQLVVQLVFFLHIDEGKDESWKLYAFLSTVPFILIIFLGSIWIMNHLDYNMSPTHISQYMEISQGGF